MKFTANINFKQEELIEKLIKDIQKKFPEVELIDVVPSAENPDTLWIEVTCPEDENREIELGEYASQKTTDILLNYGYHMLVMPTVKKNEKSTLKS